MSDKDAQTRPLPKRLLALLGLVIFELVAVAAITTGAISPLGSPELLWLLVAVITVTILFLFTAGWKLIRNRFQYSLTSFLIATLVLGAGAGSLISFLQRSERQRKAASRLESLGANVTWRGQGQPGLKEYLGRQYFEDAISVDLVGTAPLTDDDCALRGDLPHLRGLTFVHSGMSDGHLRHLENLERLQTLTIVDANIKGPGISSLASLPNLQGLEISCSPLDDDGTEALSQCTGLEILGLGGTLVDDAGLAHLTRLPRLRELYVHGTRVTNDGLKHMKEMPCLRDLCLDHTAVTDAGLIHLKPLTRLAYLSLSNTSITDAGLVHLESLQSLKILNLQKTNVTDEGVARLQEKLPNCEIAR